MSPSAGALRPLILVTNDDGIHAEGIKALARALLPIAEVAVFAPDRNLGRYLIEKTGRGRFRLKVPVPIELVEMG